MKPLKLTMSAFGSYADLQSIDFTILGTNGLYLITGETGSGKTTVFDAISFALFGRASGSARSDYPMLRSDFAGSGDKTFVKLDFACGSSVYKIERHIKKTGQDVALQMPDGTGISGERNVKQKIAEIIGLDREQFAQIVMIAQNDFLRFLQSGTDDRLKILRRIFGTQVLRDFQEQLKARAKRESEKLDLIIHDFKRYDVDVYKREEQFGEWEKQIKTDKNELSVTDKILAGYDAARQELAAKAATAENLYKSFANLAAARAMLKEHESRSGEMQQCKKRLETGSAALRMVKPVADEALRTGENLTNARANLASAKKQEAFCTAEMEAAKKNIDGLPALNIAQNAFAELSKKWEQTTERLKKLTALQKNSEEIMEKQAMLSAKQKELDGTQKILDTLPSLDEISASLNILTKELTDCMEKYAKLSGLQTDLAAVTEKQKALSGMQAEFEVFDADFAKIDGEYRKLENDFFRSQAGILAKDLKDSEPCPVCGSALHPNPAVLSAGHVTEDELKKAKEAKNAAQAKREKQSLECESAIKEIEILSKRFLADLSAHISGATMATAEKQVAEAAETLKAKINKAIPQKEACEKSLAETKAKFDNVTDRRNRLSQILASLKGESGTLVKRFENDFCEFLPDAKWETSQTGLSELLGKTRKEAQLLTSEKTAAEQSLKDLAAKWEEATKRKTAAESAHRAAQTLVTERGAKEQEASSLCAGAQEKYAEVLHSNGFSDEAEYTAALVSESELDSMTKTLTDYGKNGEQLSRDIKRLESETLDKEPPDLQKLKTEAETANSKSQELGKLREEIKSRLNITEAKLKELRAAAVNFEEADKSYAAVKQLSDTANGKLDFETYAQMAYFERVLSAANRRLKAMSQNRYTLLRKAQSSDGRIKTGLEIEALDAYTGKTRSANSLSGGESFMASLSLALGLSDIVHQSSGGIYLDAMFIDEGFGSLDTETLDIAIKTLSQMAGTDRIIGIISHVSELRERVDRQIRIEKTPGGSRIRMSV